VSSDPGLSPPFLPSDETALSAAERLADRLCAVVRGQLLGAEGEERLALARPAGQGAGDLSYGLDVPAERAIEGWAADLAGLGPLSLLTEETGWRHLGPDGRGGARELDGFGHGGPAFVIDPIDGTRNLMADLRSAFTVIGIARPTSDAPTSRDLVAGLVSELPTSDGGRARRFVGRRGLGCIEERRFLGSDGGLGAKLSERRVSVDGELRLDHAFLPFFRYAPDLRPGIARVEAAFFERLEGLEGIDTRACFDDQYISSAGHLVLLMRGIYRFVADLRPLVARREGKTSVPTKPYDLAGALVCAREAGVPLTDLSGAPLEFPLDVSTPVGYAGYANAETHAKLEPHLRAAILASGPLSGAF
jgi:hypothetical protein